MQQDPATTSTWRKSSRSGQQGDCVEVSVTEKATGA